jgi:hypothetical protein
MSGRSSEVAIRYLGKNARITDEVIESRCPYYQRFAISELEFVHTVRPEPLVVLAASQPVRVCSAGVTGISGIIALFGPALHSMPVTVGGVGAVIAAGAVTVATVQARRRPLEIRAVHQGQLVCLFSTTNRHTLGQVKRALLRVLEAIEDAR